MNVNTPYSSANYLPELTKVTPLAALFYVLASFVAIMCSHILVGMAGALGYVWLIIFLVATFYLLPLLAFTAMFTLLFFQNILLCLVVNHIDGPEVLQMAQGANFIAIAILGGLSSLIIFSKRNMFPPDQRKVLIAAAMFVGVVVVYSAYGLAQARPTSVLAYTRLYLSGPLMLAIGFYFAQFASPAYLRMLVAVTAIFMLAYGATELFFPFWLYETFKVDDFLHLKFLLREDNRTFFSVAQAIEQNMRNYLNLTGAFGLDLVIMRLRGPTLHEISYGYALMFLSYTCLFFRMPILAFLCAVMLVIAGIKGPLIMLFFGMLIYAGYRLTRGGTRYLLPVLSFTLLSYIVLAFLYGLSTRDFHVLGLIGGINGFFSNPIGRGVGVGGNMSDLAFAGRNFTDIHNAGRVDYAMESAIGVLLYQLGAASALFFIFYFRLWKTIWRIAIDASKTMPQLIVFPIAMGFLLVNGLFQEEMMSAQGWAVWLMAVGFFFGYGFKPKGNDT
jgi:hypothetical protein